jgi:hypothetical protein
MVHDHEQDHQEDEDYIGEHEAEEAISPLVVDEEDWGAGAGVASRLVVSEAVKVLLIGETFIFNVLALIYHRLNN